MFYFTLRALRFRLCNMLLVSSLLVSLLLFGEAQCHSAHRSQSIAIIDPLLTHHAVLEDELKINYFRVSNEDESSYTHWATLELGAALSDLVGGEVYLPLGFADVSGRKSKGLGDIETIFPKISFVRRYGFVMTSYVVIRAPTGKESAGLGEPGWGFAPHILMDYGRGKFGIQANAALEFETEGHKNIEGNISFAYSFVFHKAEERKLVMSPLLELAVESQINGPDNAPIATVTPGIKIASYGWHLGLGVNLPLTKEKELDYMATVQIGYHVSWNDIF
jgi:hypothetical protein